MQSIFCNDRIVARRQHNIFSSNMKFKFIVTLSLLLFISKGLIAQMVDLHTIRGTVNDESGAPLPYIQISIDSINKGAFTDLDGVFEFKDIPSGYYKITAQLIGYTTITKTVEVPSKKLVFILKEDSHQLQEIIISGKSEARKIEESAQAVKVIETKEDKQKTADLGEVLARAEGVSVQRAGGLGSTMRFSLNGLTNDQIRFFVNGVPLEFSPYSLGLANIPVNFVNRMEIYKGVLPIQFGADALGGGVNVVTNPVKPGLHGDLSYQYGSFKTHRTTMSISYGKKNFFLNTNGFYDYSANNYKVDVQVPNQSGKFENATVRRFHDDYKAHGSNVTFGIRNKKIIEELSATIFYNNLYKEVQHNNVMSGSPFGHVYRQSKNIGAYLTSDLKLNHRLNTKNALGYCKTEREFTDTSAYIYNWYGEVATRRNNSNSGEIGGNRKSRIFLWDNNFFWRSLTSYQLNDAALLALSIAPTYSYRTGDEKYSGTWDPTTSRSKLFTLVNSLALTYTKPKWENYIFIKHYLQQGKSEEPLPANLGTKKNERSFKSWGAGNVLVFNLTSNLKIKPSYEYAYRLPRPDEIFGDGAFVADNVDLKPESSHNFNLQFDYLKKKSNTIWTFQSNFFGRIIKDFILFIPNDDRSAVYDNVFSANSFGIELGGKTNLYDDKLRLNINTTWQHFYNNSDKGLFASYDGDRIPNRPYYFANAGADYSFKNIISKDDKILLFWQLRYTHQYFSSWESLGNLSSKPVIPNQTLHNIGVSYSKLIKDKPLTLSLEIQNFTNKKAYDFFGVQRPGRALFMKVITQF